MSAWLISLFTVGYLAVGLSLFMEKQPGLAIAYFGWAIGNIGLLMDLYR